MPGFNFDAFDAHCASILDTVFPLPTYTVPANPNQAAAEAAFDAMNDNNYYTDADLAANLAEGIAALQEAAAADLARMSFADAINNSVCNCTDGMGCNACFLGDDSDIWDDEVGEYVAV